MGLAHMHRRGYVHRDLKPANVLVDFDGLRVKIADLGMAKEVFESSPPGVVEYVTTRWYGAPEMWEEGFRRADLLGLKFPGDEHACGARIWEHPCMVCRWRISKAVPGASEEAVRLIDWLCSWDPSTRPTAMEALQHPFFDI
ncbi:hypothetical protein Sjap_007759 [Stephania japonica]|uniref:Protein kinase domain-containing protein n=1 Tax=Stephania japonica TaxID=461633 RepID=A0AAP0JP28_9MAGN